MASLRVGRPDTKMDSPSHTKGVRQGNAPGGMKKDPGFEGTGPNTARSYARRSTGINAGARNPIDPNSPNLSPA
ncbi:MAG: hypothetical protein AVDCRST_MAG25-76 [uncultured Rubrobacteraceae bacterium]|uniref:Uncharacterized protein n=1 Tax=uncultured Rubrobacteraceae bacterium TaxID=349277 RepID=A0A6J4R4S0_9ACTN|nr:MAG: hypothetical protein AVDCRST_MAG25-76 [uncultured Rubrobacteraceae bacterium]